MSWIARVLFEDETLAVAVIVILDVAGLLGIAPWLHGEAGPAFLVIGVIAALLESVFRAARQIDPARKSLPSNTYSRKEYP